MENAVQSGISREEFTALVDLYHRRVLKKAMSCLGNSQWVADVVQNTYMKAWINRHSLINKEAFGRWIEVICQHECWRACKKEKYALHLEELPFEPLHEENEPADNSGLYRALSLLPDADVELLSMKYFSGFSQRKIALLLGLDEKTVKSRLHEARRRLRRHLESTARPVPAAIGEEFIKRRTMVMDAVKLMDVGANCVPRMSLAAQKELLASAERNEQFSGKVLSELNAIEQGRELVAVTDGRLNLTELMTILSCCDQPMVDRLLSGTAYRQDFLKATPAGYVVLENNAILHTPDMDATARWFEETLGWHGAIDARDGQGKGTYGCLVPDNPRAVTRSTRVFEGIHMFPGKPARNTLVFVRVSGLNALRQLILDRGWPKLDAIHEEPWGARVCHVETPEGYTLKFFETI